jgi:integrase
VPEGVAREAMDQLWEDDLLARSEKRDRRPSLSELEALMSLCASNKRRRIPLTAIIVFAIYSCRRLGEICRLRWDDLNAEEGKILVKDMKHPRRKKGHDVWRQLPCEALQIIAAMPRTSEQIFPFGAESVGTAFRRHRDRAGIADLRFHDLRHEGITRLFENGLTAPFVAKVSGHKTSASLDRYEHVETHGDKYAGWEWLERVTQYSSANERNG